MEIKLRLEAKDRQGVLHDPEAGKQHDRESQTSTAFGQRRYYGASLLGFTFYTFVFSKILLYSGFAFFLLLLFSFLLHLFKNPIIRLETSLR